MLSVRPPGYVCTTAAPQCVRMGAGTSVRARFADNGYPGGTRVMYCEHCGKPVPERARYCRHCGAPTAESEAVKPPRARADPVQAGEGPARPSGCELRIRRRLAALILLLACVAVFRNLGALAFAPFSLLAALVTGVYLYRSTRYHRAFYVVLVLLGLAVYAFPPVSQPFTALFGLKGFAFTADWRGEGAGPQDPWGWLPLYVINIMVFGATVFLLLSGISSRVRAVARSAGRDTITVVALAAVMTAAFGLPWLYPAGVRAEPSSTWNVLGIGGPGPGAVLAVGPHGTSISFDSPGKLWVYRLVLFNTTGRDGEVVALMGKVGYRTIRLAPPFDETIAVTGGTKTAEKIIIPAQVPQRPPQAGERPEVAPAVLTIHSRVPLWVVTLVEQGDKRWQLTFWR